MSQLNSINIFIPISRFKSTNITLHRLSPLSLSKEKWIMHFTIKSNIKFSWLWYSIQESTLRKIFWNISRLY